MEEPAPRTLDLHLVPEAPRGTFVLIIVQPAGDPHGAERVPVVQEVDPLPVTRLEAPLGGLKDALGSGPEACEAHDARILGALDREGDVDAAVQLVHLSADPGDLLLEVDLVAQVLACSGIVAQRVQRGRDDG